MGAAPKEPASPRASSAMVTVLKNEVWKVFSKVDTVLILRKTVQAILSHAEVNQIHLSFPSYKPTHILTQNIIVTLTG